MQLYLTWIARVIAILYTLFVFSFVIDVVGGELDWYVPLVASLPGVVMLITTVIAWRWSLFGGVIFIALGASYIFQFYRRDGGDDYFGLVLMAGLPILAGVLFVIVDLIKPNKQESL